MSASRHVTDCQLRAWVLRKVPLEEVAARCGLTTSEISRRLHALQLTCQPSEDEWSPDEETIRAECDAIQQGWSQQVRDSRRVGPRPEWTPVVVHACDLRLHAS